ncbi:sperm microtubule inner protein 8 [Anabrus simplex]|uniref:sperm microtubule inner protein 8 n=1 Tax=Anabrus simplex TaxID=316456 RepID=UPI0035A2E36E
MDSQLGKLPSEHKRTTAPKSGTFPKELFYQYHPPHHYVENFDLLPVYYKNLGESEEIKRRSLSENAELASKWEEFKCKLPLPEKENTNLHNIKKFQFMNYYIRYLKPEITASWRKKLKPGVRLDEKGQCPIPADYHRRYREF